MSLLTRRRTLEITTNVSCGLRCSYCPQRRVVQAYRARLQSSGGEERPWVMTSELFARYLSTVPRTVDIHFSGFSEPWHAPECTDMVEMAHNAGHYIAVFTTADRMSDSDLERLSVLKFKRFMLHLPDGNHDMRLAPDDGYLHRIEQLRARIPNLESLTIGVPHAAILSVLGRTTTTRRVHTRAGNLQLTSTTVGSAFTPEEISSRTCNTSIVCRGDRMFSNVLLPNGDVQFCAMDYGLECRLGSLADTAYHDIVNGAEMRHLLASLAAPNSTAVCRRCEYAIPGRYSPVAVDGA